MANDLTGRTVSPLAAMSYVQQQGDAGRKRGVENQLNQLAAMSYSANTPELQQQNLSQVAALDRSAAATQEKAFQTQQDRTQKELYGLAQGWKTVPQQYRQSYYEKFLSPRLSALGMGEQPGFDEATIDGAADQIIAAFGAQGAGSNVQSTYINRAGQRVAIMRDGTQQILGEADARTQLRDQQGVAPSLIDLRTGTATPLQPGQAAPVVSATVFRSPNGEMVDVSQVTEPGLREAIMRDPEQWGLVPDGGSAQLPDRSVSQASGLTAMRPDSSQQITPYQQAQLVRQDRADVRADQAAQDARVAREQASQARQMASQQKAQQAQQAITTRQAALNNVQRGIERVRNALNAVNNTMTGSGPVGQYATRYREAGQELETATGAMQNSMLALTRVPGIGSQSDLEAKIANMIYPSLDRNESVNANTLKNLEQFYQDLSGTARQSDEADRNSIQTSNVVVDAPSGAPRQIQSAAEYEALPSGTLFIAPDGSQRRKR